MNSLSISIVNVHDPETQSEISTLLERKLFNPEKDLDLENNNTSIKKERENNDKNAYKITIKNWKNKKAKNNKKNLKKYLLHK